MTHATHFTPFICRILDKLPQFPRRRHRHYGWLVLSVAVLASLPGLTAVLHAQGRGFDEEYLRQAKELEEEVRAAGHTTAADTIAAHAFPRDPRRQYAFLSSPPTRLKAARGGDTDQLQQWRESWAAMREAQAERLYDLARQVVAADPGRAYRLLHEVLYEHPEHELARRALGLPRKPARRSSPKTRRPAKTHPWFGWSTRNYWLVQSKHFDIISHVRGSAPRQLAERLELLLSVWEQVFFEYWSDGRWLQDRLSGGRALRPSWDRFQVTLFRDREDYLKNLADVEPQIAESLGYYVPRRKTSFFYSARERPWATWHHEVTHQLFQETVGGVANPGEKSQLWVIEGAALYMESMRLFDRYATVGGYDASRLQFARYRRLRAGYFVPFAELSVLGRNDFIRRDDVRRLYSQSAGLVHYLMDGEQGELRPGFLRFLGGVYQGRESTDRLFAGVGRSAGQLEQGYTVFLQVTDRDLAFTGPSDTVRQLSLGGSRVTAKGVRHLQDLRDLEWLDLAGLPLTANDLDWVGQNRKLTQLMLEGTRVDDSIASQFSRLTKLVELDLSQTRVGDGAAPAIGKLLRLESLWLNETALTDAGLANLSRLKRLTYLDVTGSSVTQAGLRNLKQSLPKLEEIKGP